MFTVPERLLDLPFVTVLHRSPGLLRIRKVVRQPLHERPSYLSQHALIHLLAGRQVILEDGERRCDVRPGSPTLLPRGIYTISDLLPAGGEPFRAELTFFDERALATADQTSGEPGRAEILAELRTVSGLPELRAPRRQDPLAFLQKHYDKPLTLEDCALLTGQSVSTFQRSFRARTGTSPRRWIIARRMERARELSQTQQLGSRDLAQLVGYGNVSHFIRQYRRTFGRTPAAD